MHDRSLLLFFVGCLSVFANLAQCQIDDAKSKSDYTSSVLPLLRKYCFECHSGDRIEAELDFGLVQEWKSVPGFTNHWVRGLEMLESQQMPPRDAKTMPAPDRQKLASWMRQYLAREAARRDGDPGPILLRRLNNAEFNYVVQDLTQVATLLPSQEFPVDGAAGEGFTNASQALSMSPALVSKYLDASKKMAQHAVLLPSGFRFSPSTSRRDWTNEILDQIRSFYAKYSDSTGGSRVNLQGIQFETNRGGRLPVEAYLQTLLQHRNQTIDYVQLAHQNQLNAKYLETLSRNLQDKDQSSIPMTHLRNLFHAQQTRDAAELVKLVQAYQKSLWKFNSIGHIGKHLGRKDGPQTWMEATTPIVGSKEFRIPMSSLPMQENVELRLMVGDGGDGSEGDIAVWKQPRFQIPGHPDILLKDLQRSVSAFESGKNATIQKTTACLEAWSEWLDAPQRDTLDHLATKHQVPLPLLMAWGETLGLSSMNSPSMGTKLTSASRGVAGYGFIQGWTGNDALSVLGNQSDQEVRIPGRMKPHSVAVHPAPSQSIAIGWECKAPMVLHISGNLQHAHPECGNGVEYSVELRRGNTKSILAKGVSHGGKVAEFGPIENMQARVGDLFVLAVHPRDGNHACDLTMVEWTIQSGQHEWNLAKEISADPAQANPHPGSKSDQAQWHFFSEPTNSTNLAMIPAMSLLARWQTAANAERTKLATSIQELLEGKLSVQKDSPDYKLARDLLSLHGPIFRHTSQLSLTEAIQPASIGLPAQSFGSSLIASSLAENDIAVQAPSELKFFVPRELLDSATFVTTCELHGDASNGSIQSLVASQETSPQILHQEPWIAKAGSAKSQSLERGFAQFRELFPAALCYTMIVPVDEVVTLTLFYREDDHLKRLMLNDYEILELDRLWDELFYVAQEPILFAAAFEQIAEFATQDASELLKSFEPMRGPIQQRVVDFKNRMVADETRQLDALVAFGKRAMRGHAVPIEKTLHGLYSNLRKQELDHDSAFRLTLASVFTSPGFLYRMETPKEGKAFQKVQSVELANRLSFLLWSSLPDDQLLKCAHDGTLQKPDVLHHQMQRMLADPRAHRFAKEFGCQWLHVYDFASHDEKSEQAFPEFAELRASMEQETVQFLFHLFRDNESVLDVLDCDYTYLNPLLAKHYGITGPEGDTWQKVRGVTTQGRGGVLTQASILSKQSGASRTSPILRGNWLTEVLLGDKLPRPPKNVPTLPEGVPAGLTERQLIERHSSDPACARCHEKVDPLGFAMEQYDAIGKLRTHDAQGFAIDTKTKLQDGHAIDNMSDLKRYLSTVRRDAFLRQFNRKLLGYALGRSVILSDEPLIERMNEALRTNDYRVQAALEQILHSVQFQSIRDLQFDEERFASVP